MFLGWSPVDQAKALAWVDFQASLCHRCSTEPDEWMGDDGRPAWPPPWVYYKQTCQGCLEREAFVENAYGDPDKMTDSERKWRAEEIATSILGRRRPTAADIARLENRPVPPAS